MNLPATIEKVLFGQRKLFLALFIILTGWMVYSASQLRIDAGFAKQLPKEHEYIKVFLQYQEEFGLANRLRIALMVPEGEDIFTREYFQILKKASDEVFNFSGINRNQVRSLWTPNVRFVEVTEEGFAGGNVIHDDYNEKEATEEDLQKVRENIIKSGYLGRLVANDFSGAIIEAELLEIDPNTGEKLDYLKVADELEALRQKIEEAGKDLNLSVHIIGFAKVVGDVADGARNVLFFFLISFFVTGIFVYLYSQSFRLTAWSLIAGLVAVIWQMGTLTFLGYGIDPMSILVPFLVFAIAVSHGVQMVRSFRAEMISGSTSLEAARSAFRQLLVPGGVALITDTIGFVTILLIPIEIIRELAIAASLGVGAIIFTNLFLLPLLLSYTNLSQKLRAKVERKSARSGAVWSRLAVVSQSAASVAIIIVASGLFIWGFAQADKVKPGDVEEGVPELWPSSRYNQDIFTITENFSVSADILSVIVESIPDGSTDYEVMSHMDRFIWHMENVEGVQSVIGLAKIAKIYNSFWNEGYPKWRRLPRDPSSLAQSVMSVETSSGLLNGDSTVMPILIFLEDHKAETIDRVIGAIKKFRVENPSEKIQYQLASGNVGVMAATNEEVSASQFSMLFLVFAAVILLCLIGFRSWKAAVCIVIPLALVSVLAYALMYFLEIGLKVSTLPVVALGVGVGVDYGIYLFSRLQVFLDRGDYFEDALKESYRLTGSAVVFTGLTLATGVSTWLFSSLKFQADMGILLTFMFLLNMLGAMILLPAIARWLYPHHCRREAK